MEIAWFKPLFPANGCNDSISVAPAKQRHACRRGHSKARFTLAKLVRLALELCGSDEKEAAKSGDCALDGRGLRACMGAREASKRSNDMAKIGEDSWQEALKFRDQVRETIRHCTSVEEVAQRLVSSLYERFSESMVLVRCFVTMPLNALPVGELAFVRGLAQSEGCEKQLLPTTPVLSLLGTGIFSGRVSIL